MRDSSSTTARPRHLSRAAIQMRFAHPPRPMAALLRNPFHAGALDKRPASPKPPPLAAAAAPVDLADKPSASHNEHSRDAPPLPPGAWDSHMHIIDPDRHPLSPSAVYQPSKFTVAQAVAFESAIGAANVVIVQPSIYDNDNACLLEALKVLGPSRARAVVAFDPQHTAPAVLHDWHKLGVRGVRINLQSTARTMPDADIEALLHRYAAAVRPVGWVIQLYVPMAMVTTLERIVPALGVRIVIDHLGSPDLPARGSSCDPYALDGFAALARLLQAGGTYVKMSAPYRLSKRGAAGGGDDDDYLRDVEPVAREILRIAGRSNVVFATDWPHTRFEGLNIRPWIEHVVKWCHGDQGLIERVFKGNAEDLWA